VVADGAAAGPNLPWSVDEGSLAKEIGVPRVCLINDLAATGYGIAALPPDALHTLHPGRPVEGANVGLLAAGTGLGETILVRQGADLVPIPSEGGHADFAPRTDREILIFRALREKFGRVSYERVLSGPGLVHVAEVLHETAGASSAWAGHLREAGESASAEAVSARALERSCPQCEEALGTFVAVYGAEAGNLALRGLARGGIYLGGGIAPKILPALASPGFIQAFRSKDPLDRLLDGIPVRAILEQRTAMLGAARYATLR
jgi:glucokinase